MNRSGIVVAVQNSEILVPDGEHRSIPMVIAVAESQELRVRVGKGATAVIVCICRGAPLPVHVIQSGEVAAGATLHWINITLGDGITQSLESTCSGEGGVSTVDWIFRASDNEKQILSAKNIFSGAHGGGEITMKGVAEGKAHVKASGMIDIGEKGTGTHTYLSQHVLMLDPTAKVDAVPGLEIRTNDVKASHSATVSRVTPEDLFYFESRGIAEREARRMYIDGFLGELLSRIADPKARAQAEEALQMHP